MIGSARRLPEFTATRPHGDLRDRIDRAIDHELEIEGGPYLRMELEHPDPQWHWGADYFARWVGAMATAEATTGRHLGIGERARELIGYQRGDGSFGSYSDPHDGQEWFGMSRTLVALVDVATLSGDEAAMIAVERLAAYYASAYPMAPEWQWETYASALEGLVMLALRTREPAHVDLARRVAEASPTFQGIFVSPHLDAGGGRVPVAGHMHSHLSTARGLVGLAVLTQEQRWLDAVLEVHREVAEETLWVSGGVPENMPWAEGNETCADADWLRLNLDLWRATGGLEYLDLAETTWRNQLEFDQAATGGFCYLRSLTGRAGSTFDACCSHSGLMALLDVLRHTYAVDSDAVVVNFLHDSSVVLTLPSGSIELATSVVEEPGRFRAVVALGSVPDGPTTLRFRVPAWAGEARFAVNGGPQTYQGGAGYVSTTRRWAVGDTLTIDLPLVGGVILGERSGTRVTRPDVAAFTYGPRVLCLSERDNPDIFVAFAQASLPGSGIPAFDVTDPRVISVPGRHRGKPTPLRLTPIAAVGGQPSGRGRVHRVRAAQFLAWIPFEVTEAGLSG